MPSPPSAYASPGYAHSLGLPLWRMAGSGGFLQIREVPALAARDLAGLHPVWAAPHPEALMDDLLALDSRWLSVTLVPDPLQSFDAPALAAWADVVRPLGDHLLIALRGRPAPPSAHHRRQIRRAARQPGIEIRVETQPANFLAVWQRLYGHLMDKVQQRTAPSSPWLSAEALAAGLALPDSLVVSAWLGDEPLGADWYLRDGSALRAHLSAYSPRGYALAVSYLLLDQAIQLFRDEFEQIDLGGIPQTSGATGGLARFKEGWATHRRARRLYGKMLRPWPPHATDQGYQAPPAGTQANFFPPYRAPALPPQP